MQSFCEATNWEKIKLILNSIAKEAFFGGVYTHLGSEFVCAVYRGTVRVRIDLVDRGSSASAFRAERQISIRGECNSSGQTHGRAWSGKRYHHWITTLIPL
jgi:hypothetical protein